MSLKAYADAVLASVVDIWTTEGVALPALQYVAPGPFSSVSFDCDQVTVAIDNVTRGAPGNPQTGYTALAEASATLTIAVVRLCAPTSEDDRPPPAAQQAAFADITLRDLDLLWRNAKAIMLASGCKHHGLVSAQPLEIQGGAGGAKLTASIDLLDA